MSYARCAGKAAQARARVRGPSLDRVRHSYSLVKQHMFLRSRGAFLRPGFACCGFAHPNEGWRSAEITLGCSGTRGRALTRHARRLARRLASLGRRSPLGAPPWRFWAPVPRFPHRTLPSSLRFGEQPDRSQRAPRVRVVVPGGRGPGASRGDGCEPAPRDATPRSIFGIASRRRPHERGCAPYISAALCSQAQNELKPSPQSEFEKSI